MGVLETAGKAGRGGGKRAHESELCGIERLHRVRHPLVCFSLNILVGEDGVDLTRVERVGRESGAVEALWAGEEGRRQAVRHGARTAAQRAHEVYGGVRAPRG